MKRLPKEKKTEIKLDSYLSFFFGLINLFFIQISPYLQHSDLMEKKKYVYFVNKNIGIWIELPYSCGAR